MEEIANDGRDGLARPPSPAGSDSALSDASEPKSRQDIMGSIGDALDGIETAGTFASSAGLKLDSFGETLGLFVYGVGNINVPLEEEQARLLIAQCRQAPYGKGSETIVDTSVRNTWELDASRFELRGAAWPQVFESCISQVARSLGITSPIRAELYKMLIYEKGAMFKSHTDTEKIPGMFGTLVICLPSPHEGGDLVVRHRGQTKTYKTSENQPSILCWYSDVHHEVLPVTSGYRWVLTYNLAIPPGLERPSAALRRSETRELRHALRRWLAHEAREAKADDQDPHHLYYLLDHEYTEASVAFRALKTTDLVRVQCLKDLSTELDFDVFLAVLEKKEEGGVEMDWDRGSRKRSWFDDDDDYDTWGGCKRGWHELNDIYETSVTVKKLVDLDGSQLRSEMAIDAKDIESNLIQGIDPFEGVKDRNEDYEGYMGNSGPTATHWYRTSVAVLIPRNSTDEYLTRNLGREQAQDMLPKYVKKCLDPKSQPSTRKILRQLAKTAWAPDTGRDSWRHTTCKRNPDIVFEVLKTAFMLRDYELFGNVMTWAGTEGVRSTAFSLVKAATLAHKLDLGQLKQRFAVKPHHTHARLTACNLVENLSNRQLDDLAECLEALRPSDTEDNADLEALNAELVDLSLKKLEQGVKKEHLREEDGYAIVALVSRSRDFDLFKTRVLPIIEAYISSTPFALAATQELTHCSSDGVFPQPESLDLCKKLTGSAISTMDISALRDRDTLQAQQPRSYYSAGPPPLTPAQLSSVIQWTTLTAIVENCLTNGWDDILLTLSLKVAAQAPSIPRLYFHRLWLPFLRDILKLLPPSLAPRYKQLALALLESYVTNYIGREPPQLSDSAQPDLSLPEARCLGFSIQGCRDCAALSAFLTSRTQRVGRFPVGKDRRRHLHQVLDRRFSGGAGPAVVTHETDRSTRPETLVVTKVGGGADGERQRVRKAWEERVEKGKRVIQAVNEEGRLEGLLGEEEFRAVVEMEVLRKGEGGEGVAGAPAGVAGSKRTAEDAGMDNLGRGAVSRF